METKLQHRIKKTLRNLAEDPFTSRSGCDIKQLHGCKRDFHRLRVGDYRLIYAIIKKTVKVTAIFKRKKGYSFLE